MKRGLDVGLARAYVVTVVLLFRVVLTGSTGGFTIMKTNTPTHTHTNTLGSREAKPAKEEQTVPTMPFLDHPRCKEYCDQPFELTVCRPADMSLVLRSLGGDPYAISVLKAVSEFLRGLENPPYEALLECVLCGKPFMEGACDGDKNADGPDAILLMLPYNERPHYKGAIACGLCPRCARHENEVIEAKATAKFGARIEIKP